MPLPRSYTVPHITVRNLMLVLYGVPSTVLYSEVGKQLRLKRERERDGRVMVNSNNNL